MIKSKKQLKVELKVKIPKDGEIKVNQFVNFTINEELENEYVKGGFLKVPNELMIYAQFSYKTYSGFKYWTYVESDIVNLK